jgi:hypothetical protein
MSNINQTFLDAVSKTFDGHFVSAIFLNSSTLSLTRQNNEPVALLNFQGNVLSRSVFYNEDIYLSCIPDIMYTREENKLLKKAFSSFCLNDALVHMIKTKGDFDLKSIHRVITVNQRVEHMFYNSCTLSDIDLYHSPKRHNFYYSYDKRMVLDNAGKFHPILVLDISLKQKTYSILLSPELNKAANISTFSGNNADRCLLTFEQLFDNGVEINDLKTSIDSHWTYDIFFYYIDILLNDRKLVESIFDSCSNYADMMNLVEMNRI